MIIEKGRYLIVTTVTGAGPGKVVILKEAIESVCIAGDGQREMGIIDLMSGTRHMVPPDDARVLIAAMMGEEV